MGKAAELHQFRAAADHAGIGGVKAAQRLGGQQEIKRVVMGQDDVAAAKGGGADLGFGQGCQARFAAGLRKFGGALVDQDRAQGQKRQRAGERAPDMAGAEDQHLRQRGRGGQAFHAGQGQFHPATAALADLGAKGDIHAGGGLVPRQHLPGAVDGHVFQLSAADGALRHVGGDEHRCAGLARGRATDAGDLDPDHLSLSMAISTRSGVAGASMRGFSA